jgi:glutamate synthase domain-containing protein 1
MVARLDNLATHEVVVKALTALENLEHRGASGADPLTGDGAGILMQMPDELLRAQAGCELGPLGSYGVMMCFLPTDTGARERIERLLERTVGAEGQRVLGWRDVPVRPEHTGATAAGCRPEIRQLFVGAGGVEPGAAALPAGFDQEAFER